MYQHRNPLTAILSVITLLASSVYAQTGRMNVNIQSNDQWQALVAAINNAGTGLTNVSLTVSNPGVAFITGQTLYIGTNATLSTIASNLAAAAVATNSAGAVSLTGSVSINSNAAAGAVGVFTLPTFYGNGANVSTNRLGFRVLGLATLSASGSVSRIVFTNMTKAVGAEVCGDTNTVPLVLYPGDGWAVTNTAGTGSVLRVNWQSM